MMRKKVQRKLVNSARLDGYDAGYDNGVIKGKEEGAKERELTIAKNLLSIGLSKENIKKATGLSSQEIDNL